MSSPSGQAGSFTTQIEVVTDDDSDSSNNSASITVQVDAPATPSPPPGGGGSFNWASLLLGALGLVLRRKRWSASAT